MIEQQEINTYKGEFPKDDSKIRCLQCDKIGHKARCCEEKQGTNASNVSVDSKYMDTVTLYAPSQDTYKPNEAPLAVANSVGCLESGCTSHMRKDKSAFSNIASGVQAKLNLAVNTHSSTVKGKGPVNTSITSNNRVKTLRLDNSLYVPELHTNLLSVSKATDKGYKVIFDKDAAEVINRSIGKTDLIAKRKNNLYILRESDNGECKNVIEKGVIPKKDSLYDYHVRLGHLNVQDFVKAAKSGHF